jgi:hypothetical protein
MLLAKVDLLQGLVQAEHRRHHNPAQAAAAPAPGLCQPAVVAPAQSHLSVRPTRQWPQEDRRIQDMHIDSECVHMGQPGRNVGYLAGLVWCILANVRVLGKSPAFDQPVLPVPAGFWDNHLGLAGTLRLLHILPRPFRLHHMGVCVDHCQAWTPWLVVSD